MTLPRIAALYCRSAVQPAYPSTARNGQQYVRTKYCHMATFSFLPELDPYFVGNMDERPIKTLKKTYNFTRYIENREQILQNLCPPKAKQTSSFKTLNAEYLNMGTVDNETSLVGQDSRALDSGEVMERMMEAGVHLGHSQEVGHRNNAPFIYGVRAGIHIIDLEWTLACLRRSLLVARELGRLGGTLLIVGTRLGVKKIAYGLAEETGSFVITDKWLAGTLTNASHVVKKTGSFVPGNGQSVVVRLPDLMIVLDGGNNVKALEEANEMGVPTIGICDTNVDPTQFTFPIPANDDSQEGVQLIATLFSKAVNEGRMEREKSITEREFRNDRESKRYGLDNNRYDLENKHRDRIRVDFEFGNRH